MKKLFLILLSVLFIGCNNSFWNGNKDVTITNNSNKDVYIKSSNNELFLVKQNEKKVVPEASHTEFKVLTCYRCTLKYTYLNNYSVENIEPEEVSVFNSSTHTIILKEESNNIGTYEELLAEATKFNCDITDVSIEVIIPPNEIKSFKLYTKNPCYVAKYDNNIKANITSLSFF